VIPAGRSTGIFAVLTKTSRQKTLVTFTATDALGSNTAQVNVLPPQVTLTNLTFANPSVFGGNSTTATLTYSGTIPSSGIPMSIFSSEAAATVPTTVNLAAGTISTNFVVRTTTVSFDVPVTITASYGVLQITGNMTVLAKRTGTLTLSSSPVPGGNNVKLTVSISSAAPSTGIQVQITQNSTFLSQPGGVSIIVSTNPPTYVLIPLTGSSGPPTITIPAGQTSVTLTLATPYVASPVSTTISGNFVGQDSTGSATLTLDPSVEWK
jgi:hypothetical protein